MRDHGHRVAVVAGGEPTTYATLADLVDARRRILGSTRSLVLLAARTDLDTVVTHLAALADGHVVLPVDADRPDHVAALAETWDVDVIADGAALDVRRPAAAREPARLHDDLALLMSTSGTTGSPRLVRLGRAGVEANTDAVVEALGVRCDDVAALTLPLHYCYGLSVLHTHLRIGATVVRPEHPVATDGFWDEAARHAVTTFPGVPHTFELLERHGWPSVADGRAASVRYLTQAGGAMRPERVRAWAERGARAGFDLRVMYGQTEATARMTVLPADLAAVRPGSVGRAVPGSRVLAVDTGDPDRVLAAGEVGELVLEGPGVMLGYAESAADLARGRDVVRLRTGDLGRVGADGLVEVVGRTARFAKVLGLRVDLDRVERALDAAGLPALVVDGGDHLAVLVRGGHRRTLLARDAAADATGLPVHAVRVAGTGAIPLLASGKPDRSGVLAAVAALAGDRGPGETVADLYATVLAVPAPAPSATFAGLGGDSLSFVEASVRLERLVGTLPHDWHVRPVAELDALRTAHADAPPPTARRTGVVVETGVVVRALAITAVVAGHANLLTLLGGAHVLLVLAGHQLARFHLAPTTAGDRVRGLLRGAARVAVPTVVWAGAVTLVSGFYPWTTVLLLNDLLGPEGWSEPAWYLWFVEVLVVVLLGAAALFAVPVVHRAERRWPFALPVALTLAALTTRFGLVPLADGDVIHRAPAVLWLAGLGWAGARATTPTRRLLVSALALAAVPGFFDDPAREALVLAGVLVLVWVRRVRLPRPLVAPLAVLASASLWIYLTHWQVYPHLEDRWPLAATVSSLLVGVLAWRAWESGVRRLAAVRRRVAPSSPGRPTAAPAVPRPRR
ncbi:MAG: AMP-dependent synthetase [Nocardioides sp.]|nr:AMP-dependent synthetase [Nocardioides sp.]